MENFHGKIPLLKAYLVSGISIGTWTFVLKNDKQWHNSIANNANIQSKTKAIN